ncbi:L-aminoadipate-semialdehyde dehydrogenase [Hysterangium stoloniferum]|nr:L-aminoadipate-semialdehyde dehydrogenase [Hysterangium stoloniferum]
MTIFHSVNHLVQVRVAHAPDDIILAVPDVTLKYTKYTNRELDIAATLMAKHYVDAGLLPGRAVGDSTSQLTVGLLAQSGFDYIVNELALARLGYCILLISPNNSPPAVLHLLMKTQAEAVIASDTFIHIVDSALKLSDGQSDVVRPRLISQPSSDIYNAEARKCHQDIAWKYPLEFAEESELPYVIIHSSGSTGYPKPISISQRSGINNYSQHAGHRAFTTLPLYHNHGHSNFYRAMHAGKPIFLFPTGLIPLTKDAIVSLLNSPDCNAEAFHAVPYILNILAESEEGINILRRMKAVMSAGSALPDAIGDRLVDVGVNLVVQMGTTEVGQIGTSARDFEVDKDWDYVRIPEHFRKYFRFDDQGDGTYELVVLDGYHTKACHTLLLVMSNQPDGSYRTRDLYVFHSSIGFAVKFCGRLDDTLVMINGEKTNPVPIELGLKGECPYISDVIIFGAGRAQIGALMLPSELGKDKAPEELLELIAPALAIANGDAPSHSQLSPEAIIFLTYGTAIPRADKGSPIRARTYMAFEMTIDDLYRRLEGLMGDESQRRNIETVNEAEDAVLENIKETIGEDNMKDLTSKTDLFLFGLDSLQATRIRNAIQRTINIGTHQLSSNFVFDHPSVEEMARELHGLASGDISQPSSSKQIETALKMVEEHRGVFSAIPRSYTSSIFDEKTQCILLTGATGSLGAYLLAQFLSDETVSSVYCLARASSHEMARARVLQSMKDRGLVAMLHESKLTCYAADFGKDNLGLSEQEYGGLQEHVTCILHCAWPVNFNLGISSFTPHIQGAVNLMKLAISTMHSHPAQFYFCSSVSAIMAWLGPGPAPEEITDTPLYAQDMGYAQSKASQIRGLWVVEKLCQIASETTQLKARVLRIGQLVGDSETGMWNESEAISLIIKGAQTLGVMPILDESIAWLPVNTAALIIHQLLSIPEEKHTLKPLLWHVVQPTQVPWSSILDYLTACGLNFKRIPREDWLTTLWASNPDPIQNPTIKLLSFYERKYAEGNYAGKAQVMCTEKVEKWSSALRDAPYPDEGMVKKWVESWRRTGFLN